ncbi:unnamed protein product [Fusarium graminearum]|uniref:Chromosome 1, complete genome n=1 Tax=Gibberella zeae (strain ATCC MYA-4620 / CBS 123657 / FGSC 9075 / NRRL 31084 / PH-1) TaxID=229533 RepID=A0A098CZX2_GIBZE|nr:unnamed protein product [Fusarium graminearum]CZS75425.1 unnamed protein product [Fusarium graminearum]
MAHITSHLWGYTATVATLLRYTLSKDEKGPPHYRKPYRQQAQHGQDDTQSSSAVVDARSTGVGRPGLLHNA